MKPLPTDLGLEAYEFLQTHGLNAVNPPIRSSDSELYEENPLIYFLKVRLGLVPMATASDALREGSWFHTILEHDIHNKAELAPILQARKAELLALGELQGLKRSQIDASIAEAEQDALVTLAWYDAALVAPLRADSKETTASFLHRYELLAAELPLEATRMVGGKSRATIRVRYDRLYYHPKTKSLWIFDAKTTSEPVEVRMSTCAHEFQTLLYLDTLAINLGAGEIHKLFPALPPDVTVGGMFHWCLQKPAIRLSANDRKFTLVEKTLKTGPRAGQTITEKVYEGEPLFENYLRRVRDFYMATGDYLHEAPKRATSPVVGISETLFKHVDLDTNMWYDERLKSVHYASTVSPYPGLFPPNTTSMRKYNKLSPYYPFMIAPIHRWPEVIKNEGFTIQHRE